VLAEPGLDAALPEGVVVGDVAPRGALAALAFQSRWLSRRQADPADQPASAGDSAPCSLRPLRRRPYPDSAESLAHLPCVARGADCGSAA